MKTVRGTHSHSCEKFEATDRRRQIPSFTAIASFSEWFNFYALLSYTCTQKSKTVSFFSVGCGRLLHPVVASPSLSLSRVRRSIWFFEGLVGPDPNSRSRSPFFAQPSTLYTYTPPWVYSMYYGGGGMNMGRC